MVDCHADGRQYCGCLSSGAAEAALPLSHASHARGSNTDFGFDGVSALTGW